jgi:hypothetical protein
VFSGARSKGMESSRLSARDRLSSEGLGELQIARGPGSPDSLMRKAPSASGFAGGSDSHRPWSLGSCGASKGGPETTRVKGPRLSACRTSHRTALPSGFSACHWHS